MEWADGLGSISVDFELTNDRYEKLRIGRNPAGVSIVASYSRGRFAEFADKIEVLVRPENPIGHHYLAIPGMTGSQIIVSKAEYAPDFGDEGGGLG